MKKPSYDYLDWLGKHLEDNRMHVEAGGKYCCIHCQHFFDASEVTHFYRSPSSYGPWMQEAARCPYCYNVAVVALEQTEVEMSPEELTALHEKLYTSRFQRGDIGKRKIGRRGRRANEHSI